MQSEAEMILWTGTGLSMNPIMHVRLPSRALAVLFECRATQLKHNLQELGIYLQKPFYASSTVKFTQVHCSLSISGLYDAP